MFDLDEQQDGTSISAAVLAIAADPGAARAKAARAMAFVHRRQRETMANLRRELGR
jgi:hypothetical protein